MEEIASLAPTFTGTSTGNVSSRRWTSDSAISSWSSSYRLRFLIGFDSGRRWRDRSGARRRKGGGLVGIG
ncbi:plant-specific domain TIGR01615 family protein [Musa troglodytarum]|uniref:Plant-specific domain TIGR01615 family protein n=1 Tax=Musa troglodytarum TaxID=320322 RepID=A0A9E7HLJ5_9LILI|nr:plant-specific domain TIGR01615 family protein [Musa troglodytarum]